MACNTHEAEGRLRSVADVVRLEWDQEAADKAVAAFCAAVNAGRASACNNSLWNHYVASFVQLRGRNPTTRFTR